MQPQPATAFQDNAPVAAPSLRTAAVDFDKTWLRTPLNWRLRTWGQGVGGYAPANGSIYRHATKEAAEAAAAIWIELGIYPAYQTPEQIAAARAEMAR